MTSQFITDKNIWEEITSQFEGANFLQSFMWGEFQTHQRNSVYRKAIMDDKTPVAAMQYYIVKSRFFTYAYCPRGPLVAKEEGLDMLLSKIKQTKGVDFFMIEPINTPYFERYKMHGFQQSSFMIQPQHTSILSLTVSDETLLSNLRKTTRAIIKKFDASVVVTSHSTVPSWDEIKSLLHETQKRQRFNAHYFSYIKSQFETFAKYNSIKLYTAQTNQQTVAWAIVVYYKKTAVYLHAASGETGRRLCAPHKIVWTALLDAKKEGYELFDFWGIAPEGQPHHPWAGITVFKKGFGGEDKQYPQQQIFPTKQISYNLYLFMTVLRASPTFKTIHRIVFSERTTG